MSLITMFDVAVSRYVVDPPRAGCSREVSESRDVGLSAPLGCVVLSIDRELKLSRNAVSSAASVTETEPRAVDSRSSMLLVVRPR